MPKTFNIEEIKNRVNTILADDNNSDEAKLLVAGLLEGILIESRNYHGFKYVDWENGGYERYLKFQKDHPMAHTPPMNTFIGSGAKRVYL